MSGRNPPLCCALPLIDMQGHQAKQRQRTGSTTACCCNDAYDTRPKICFNIYSRTCAKHTHYYTLVVQQYMVQYCIPGTLGNNSLQAQTVSMCVVCVFFPSILDIKFVGRTSRGHTGGRSHRIFNPPSFCGARLDFCREKDSAIPFPRRP